MKRYGGVARAGKLETAVVIYSYTRGYTCLYQISLG